MPANLNSPRRPGQKPKPGFGLNPPLNGVRLPPRPTAALPGTRFKLAVMTDRARRGLALFHPGDASLDMRRVDLSPRGRGATLPQAGRRRHIKEQCHEV